MSPFWNPKQIRKTLVINSSLDSYVSTHNKKSSQSLQSIKHMKALNPIVRETNKCLEVNGLDLFFI